MAMIDYDETAAANGERRRDGMGDAASKELLQAAFSLHSASCRLSTLDAESRAVARLAAEALMRGDVSPSALTLVADVEGRSGIIDLLRGSARAQPL